MKGQYEVQPEEIHALLRGELSPSDAERLRARIRESAPARALYDQLAEAEDALGRRGLEDRAEARLFAALPATRPKKSRARFAWSAFAAFAAAAVLLVSIDARFDDGGYTRRGAPALDGDHVLQVLRARLRQDAPVTIEPATTVRAGDPLRFAVASRGRPATVGLLAVMAGERRVIVASAPVDEGGEVRRLDGAFTVPEDAGSELQIVAVFAHGQPLPQLDDLDLEPRDAGALSVRAVRLALETSP